MSRASEFDPSKLTYGSDNEESRMRMRELMLFIAERCQYDPHFGVTKLNKILFYCDFFAFAKLGKPITGMPYSKLPYGPVPKAAESARRQMQRDADVVVTSGGQSSFRPQRMIPLRDADLSLFSGPEIALVDGIIEALSDATGSELRDISHGKAWQAVEMGGRIPYEAVFVSDAPYAEEDVKRAHELIAAGEIED